MKPEEMVLRPAFKLAYLLMVISVMASLILLFLPLPIFLKIILVLSVLTITAYFILRDVLLALPHSWHSLAIGLQNEMVMTQRNGEHFICEVLPNSVVFSYCSVLRLKLKGCFWGRSLVLVEESAEPEIFRRWRVWFRWGKHSALKMVDDDSTLP
jgi:energy-coupling factor transporter transmembrane protein EcfT